MEGFSAAFSMQRNQPWKLKYFLGSTTAIENISLLVVEYEGDGNVKRRR